jgi:hypothetical protein
MVSVQAMPELPAEDPFWQMIQGFWAEQRLRGHVPRTAEEVEAERRAVRDEWEARSQRLESQELGP